MNNLEASKDRPFKRADYYLHIEQAKDYFEYCKWVDALKEYEKWLHEGEKRLSKHLGVAVEFQEK